MKSIGHLRNPQDLVSSWYFGASGGLIYFEKAESEECN